MTIKFNKQRSLDRASFCCEACRKRLEHQRSVGRNTRRKLRRLAFLKIFFGSSVATCRLACAKILLSINEKKAREKFRKRSNIVQFGRWRDSSSSALCSILSQSTLFQPMKARVISELYYYIKINETDTTANISDIYRTSNALPRDGKTRLLFRDPVLVIVLDNSVSLHGTPRFSRYCALLSW